VVSFTALLPGKEPLVPIGWEAMWVPEPGWTRWWREKFPAPAGKRTPAHPTRRPLGYGGSPSWCGLFLKKLLVLQGVKKLIACYGTQRFITVFTRTRY